MIWTFFIGLIGYEAIMWGWTMNRHAAWLKKHPEESSEYPMVGHKRLSFVSTTTALVSLASIIGWIYLTKSHDGECFDHKPILALTILFIQLSHVNLFVVIARYTCLPRSMWPLICTWLSMLAVKFFGVKEPPLSSLDVHICRKNLHRRKEDLQCEISNRCNSKEEKGEVNED